MRCSNIPYSTKLESILMMFHFSWVHPNTCSDVLFLQTSCRVVSGTNSNGFFVQNWNSIKKMKTASLIIFLLMGRTISYYMGARAQDKVCSRAFAGVRLPFWRKNYPLTRIFRLTSFSEKERFFQSMVFSLKLDVIPGVTFTLPGGACWVLTAQQF